MPARVLLQDFTGVPCVVDLAAMRAAMRRLGGDPARINPRIPVDLVIDHSVQVDAFGSPDALKINSDLEFSRNLERYEFLAWGSRAFANFRVVPPASGICHQLSLRKPVRTEAMAVPMAPMANPMAHTTQTQAAVVRPRIVSLYLRMTPAPKNPMPVRAWAAIRPGSTRKASAGSSSTIP